MKTPPATDRVVSATVISGRRVTLPVELALDLNLQVGSGFLFVRKAGRWHIIGEDGVREVRLR